MALDDAPPKGYSRRVYLRVGFPAFVADLVPLNVTGLLGEWESLLNPVRALRSVTGYLDHDWIVGDKFAEGDLLTRALHIAAADPAVIERFLEARGTVTDGESEVRIASLVEPTSDGPELLENAIPILLGLGVLSTAHKAVGLNGRTLRDKMHEQAEADARQRDEEDARETLRVDEERGLA